jgi:eukaryotic translation initiation factor 2C
MASIGPSHDWRNASHELYYPVPHHGDQLLPKATTAPTGRPWANEASFKKSLVQLNKQTKKASSTNQAKYPLQAELRKTEDGHALQTVLANYFELHVDTADLYEYEVLDLEDQGRTRKRVQALFQRAINAWPHLNNNQDSFATDKRKIIVSWQNLHEGLAQPIEPGQGTEKEGAIWAAANITNGNNPIQARLKFVGKVRFDSLHQQTNAARAEANSDLSSVERCLNILVSKSFDHEVLRLSANKFFVKRARNALVHESRGVKSESQTLEIIRGYYFAIKPGMGNLMNFNVATSAFFRPVLVSEFLEDNATFESLEERLAILSKLRVFIEPEHTEERFRKTGARIKAIHRIGDDTNKNIEQLSFRKKVRDADGKLHIVDGVQQFEDGHVYVTDHLKEGK